MYQYFHKSLLIFFFFLHFWRISSQELPPITQYRDQISNAGNQNWMLDQDLHFYMYFANNEGLLEYNGSNWTLYPSPNETIIRSVKVVGEKIYTGSYMEFGYWERLNNGNLQYISLSKSIEKKLIEDEHFWNIVAMDDYILFQSFNRIYIYNLKSKKFQFIDNHHSIFRVYKINNSIYYQAIGEGIYEIINGKGILVLSDDRIKTNRIVEIFNHDNGLIFQTERVGAFLWSNNVLTKFQYASDVEIMNNTIFTAKKLSDGGFALGTISNGVFILDKSGKIQYHITQNRGLSNNTVLSLFEDADKNLWLGLDNGIDCVNLQSPVRDFIDDQGFLGTVYTSVKFNNIIYLGTNQGLFYKNVDSPSDYQLLNGTKGQVWDLFIYDGQLFCGHDLGTFLINVNKAQLIYKDSGTWKFNAIPNSPNLLMQGNYNGLNILEKSGNTWVFKNKLQGFDISSRYFEIANNMKIYVGHEYKGILEVIPNENLTKVLQFKILDQPQKGKHISLAKLNKTIFYAGRSGIFKLNNKGIFEKVENLSSVFNIDEYVSGKLNVDNSNKMWLFTKNYIHYFTSGNFDTEHKLNKIAIPYNNIKPMIGYENITQISAYEYLVGKNDGYFILNLKEFELKSHNITITNVVKNTNKLNTNLNLNEEGKLRYDENNITINYTVPQYNKFINVEYQYILEGFQKQWSEWSNKPFVNFKNLPSGEYVFKVKAKVANVSPENVAIYKFVVKKPWYANWFAMMFYLILLLVIAYFINRTYRNHYQKQQEKLIEENNRLLEIKELENEQQLMKIKNEQLLQDVDAKEKELAVSTMTLIKKNELLELIKEDLKKSEVDKSLISKINSTIKEDNSWEIFSEAYDKLDTDFLKKMKQLHPTLTPSDLKLCAYLRLNLSSKEIAPMLHISIRSVEIKRYRLRKKLNLPHDEGLVDYILNIN